MRDLINALRKIERSNLPSDRRSVLRDDREIRRKLPSAAVLLERIDELAYESLFFQEGRLEGKPDYYNLEVLKSEGFDVRLFQRESDDHRGEIVTDKGRILFG